MPRLARYPPGSVSHPRVVPLINAKPALAPRGPSDGAARAPGIRLMSAGSRCHSAWARQRRGRQFSVPLRLFEPSSRCVGLHEIPVRGGLGGLGRLRSVRGVSPLAPAHGLAWTRWLQSAAMFPDAHASFSAARRCRNSSDELRLRMPGATELSTRLRIPSDSPRWLT